MYCPNCNAELQPGATFCTNCGAAVPADQNGYQEVYAPEVPAQDPGKSQGLIALITGIAGLVLSTVCSCIPYVSCVASPIGFVASVVAIILGAIGKKNSKQAGFKNGQATTGMILGIVAVVLTLIISIVGCLIGGAAGFAQGFAEGFNSSYYGY